MSEIRTNLDRIHHRIRGAAESAGRSIDEICLLAVSKTKPVEMVSEAMTCGQMSFGENYVQEAVEKAEKIPEADWHFIGSLQTNKVKLLGDRFRLIHSVDRLKLASELSKVALARGHVQDILLQIHIGGEETKGGFEVADSSAVVGDILALQGLRLCGLMTLPPLTEDESKGRGFFKELRQLHERLRRELPVEKQNAFSQLSMGTTHDFEWAIAEGATIVRLGTAIFGERALPGDR
jgi:pyridoxal phosphate enzyme (YggS family)